MSRWYRAYEGTVTDSKLGEVALVAGCSRSVAIAAWHCILESACTSNNGGCFTATPRNVAVTLHEPIATIDAVFLELKSLGMIENQQISAWTKRQYESDSSTSRSKKHREIKASTTRNGDATLQQQHATAPETDTDTDTEKIEPKKVLVRKPKDDISKNQFDVFWTAYPRRIAKVAAAKAWNAAIKKTLPDEIIAVVHIFAAQQFGNDPQFTAHPATWLNQERWRDDPQITVQNQFTGQKNGYSNKKPNSIDAAFDGVSAALRAEREALERDEAREARTSGTSRGDLEAYFEILP